MSGQGKKSRGKKDSLDLTKPQSKSALADLTFPVSRVRRYMKEGGFATRISISGSVFLSGILEYLAVEVLELSGNAAKDNKQQRIKPRYIQLAIRQDDELSLLLNNITIRDGGVLPHIHPDLTKSKNGKNKSKSKNKKSQLSESQEF